MGSVSRRSLLNCVGASIVGFSTATWAADDQHPFDQYAHPYEETPIGSEYSVDITLYTVDSLTTYPIGTSRRLQLLQEAIEYALPTLSDQTYSIVPDVSIAPEPVPDYIANASTLERALERFNEYVTEEVGEDIRGDDSNMLLTATEEEDRRGKAQIPFTAHSNKCAAMQGVIGYGHQMKVMRQTPINEYREGITGRMINTMLHELGHTIGLDHAMGNAWISANDPNRVVVTPMMSVYIFDENEVGTENKYQSQIPSVDREEYGLQFTPFYNPQIPPSDLVLGEEFEVVCKASEHLPHTIE